MKYREATLSNSTRKLLWFEISKILTAVLKINYCRYLKKLNSLKHFVRTLWLNHTTKTANIKKALLLSSAYIAV